MTVEELKALCRLLDKWINQPDWNKASAAWANIVETRRQVLIDLADKGVDEEDAMREG